MSDDRDSLITTAPLFIVHGVDPSGRKFAGLYTEQDARYLNQLDPRLNKVFERSTGRMVNFNQ
jgi:hypothetical protein